ncbi:hypothetical protein IFM89_002720, partial [Coptis chinensis]
RSVLIPVKLLSMSRSSSSRRLAKKKGHTEQFLEYQGKKFGVDEVFSLGWL